MLTASISSSCRGARRRFRSAAAWPRSCASVSGSDRVVEGIEAQPLLPEAVRGKALADGLDERGRAGGINIETLEARKVGEHRLVYPAKAALAGFLRADF